MYPKTAQQEHTMMKVGRRNVSLVHLVTIVWDGQSLISTAPVLVVITVQSTPPSHTSFHVNLAHLTT